MRKYFSVFPAFLLFLPLSFNKATAAEETLTWQDCIKEAAKNHPDLIAAQESVKQSEAGRKIAASSLFPQVNGNVNAATSKTSSGSNGDATSKTADSYSYGVSASQLLFDGLKNINNVNAAKENIIASQQSYRFTSSEVRLRLRTAYINVLKAQELIQVTEDIAKIRRDNFELITLRYESGLEHRGALLTADANLAQSNFGVVQAKRGLETAQRQLNKEMGRKEFSPVYVKSDFKVIDSATEKPDFEAFAYSNPSLQQLIAKKNAAQFGVKSAYANFSPTLSGQAGANRTGSHWPAQNDQWNLGLVLSMPLFEGGLRSAQVSQAKALFNQLQSNERSSRDGIIVNLEQTWTALQDALETIGVQEKQLAAAEERSKIAEAEYSTGFISYDNWTIIEDNLVRAKTDFLNAEANALFAEANWIQASATESLADGSPMN